MLRIHGVRCIAVLGLLLVSCTVAKADLLGYWDMNAGTGTTVADQSGNGINGSLVGSAGWTTAGGGKSGDISDYGTTFSGAGSDYIATSAVLPAIGTGDFAVSLWFKGAETCETGKTTGGWRFLFSIGLQGSADTLFVTTNGGGLRASLGGFFHDISGGGGSFTDTDWYNIALVRSGTNILTYVNGDLKSTMTYADTIYTASNISADKVYIGSFQGAPMSLNGAMDDVAVWNQALTDTQISGIFHGTISPLAIPEPTTFMLMATGLLGLLAYAWRKRK